MPENNPHFCDIKISSLLTYILLGLIVLLAVFFRFYYLSERGLEGIGMVYTRAPFSLLFENELVYYKTKPGYLAILYFIGKIFGYSSETILYLSAASGVFTVILVFFIGFKLFNPVVGLISAFVLSIMPLHVWISRMGMAFSPAIFFFALVLLVYSFTFSTSRKKMIFLIFAFMGLINGLIFTLHPGLCGFILSLACFDFICFISGYFKKAPRSHSVISFVSRWLTFAFLFSLPLLTFELITQDIHKEDSRVTINFGIKDASDESLQQESYFQDIKRFALEGYKLWPKWSYGEHLGYDFYIRILSRETGFFNFFPVIAGLFFFNFLLWKKRISLEQTLFVNLLILAFTFYTFNPRIIFVRRLMTPAAVPIALISGGVLYYLLKNRKVFLVVLSLISISSMTLSWQYVVVKTKIGHLVDFLEGKKINKVMIYPWIVYPENPLIAEKNIQSQNLELYRKLFFGVGLENIPGHNLKTEFLVCHLPELQIRGKVFKPVDKITADIYFYNDEKFSYSFKDVFPWRKPGISRDVAICYLYDLEKDAEFVKESFILSMGQAPWSADGHTNLGNYFAYIGMVEDAKREFKSAIQSDKGNLPIPILTNLAEFLFIHGEYEESAMGYKRIIARLNSATGEQQKGEGIVKAPDNTAMRKSVERLREIEEIRKLERENL